MSDGPCLETFKGDGGEPLPCRREAGHPGFHNATDQVWWSDSATGRQMAEHLRSLGYDVVDLNEDPEAGWRDE